MPVVSQPEINVGTPLKGKSKNTSSSLILITSLQYILVSEKQSRAAEANPGRWLAAKLLRNFSPTKTSKIC
jgi:hypothetical protein